MPYTFADYRRVHALLHTHRGSLRNAERELGAAMQEEMKADFKKANPRRKWKQGKPSPNLDFLTAKYRYIADQWYTEYLRVEQQYEALLNEIALVVVPEATQGLQLVHVAYSGAYRSQGLGCQKYTRQAAEHRADVITFHGFKAEVRATDEYSSPNYGVYANLTEEGWSLLQRKPGPSLREWVKACWKKGVNPRVYNPFLPHGIEDKLGVDYYGNDIKAVA